VELTPATSYETNTGHGHGQIGEALFWRSTMANSSINCGSRSRRAGSVEVSRPTVTCEGSNLGGLSGEPPGGHAIAGSSRASTDLEHSKLLSQVKNITLECTLIRPWLKRPWQDYIGCFSVFIYLDPSPTNICLAADITMKRRLNVSPKPLSAYTDGSVHLQTGRAGCAFVVLESLQVRCSLPNFSSITDAELHAILLTLEWFLLLGPSAQRLVILSDAQSVLRQIRNFDKKEPSNPHLFSKVMENLYFIKCSGRKVVLQWIPAHLNILGNELADKQAKLSRQLPDPVPFINSNISSEKTFQKWHTVKINLFPASHTLVYGDSTIQSLLVNYNTPLSTICLPGAKASDLIENLRDDEISGLLRRTANIILMCGSTDTADPASLYVTIDISVTSEMKDLKTAVKSLCPNAQVTIFGNFPS